MWTASIQGDAVLEDVQRSINIQTANVPSADVPSIHGDTIIS